MPSYQWPAIPVLLRLGEVQLLGTVSGPPDCKMMAEHCGGEG